MTKDQYLKAVGGDGDGGGSSSSSSSSSSSGNGHAENVAVIRKPCYILLPAVCLYDFVACYCKYHKML
jgi:hypothetical protein